MASACRIASLASAGRMGARTKGDKRPWDEPRTAPCQGWLCYRILARTRSCMTGIMSGSPETVVAVVHNSSLESTIRR